MHMPACACPVSYAYGRANASGRIGSRSYQLDSPEFQYSPSSSYDGKRDENCRLILKSEIRHKQKCTSRQVTSARIGLNKIKTYSTIILPSKTSSLVNGSSTTTRTVSLDFLRTARKNIALDSWKLNHDLGGNPQQGRDFPQPQ